MKYSKGFTVIMIVVSIIGIVEALVMPSFTDKPVNQEVVQPRGPAPINVEYTIIKVGEDRDTVIKFHDNASKATCWIKTYVASGVFCIPDKDLEISK